MVEGIYISLQRERLKSEIDIEINRIRAQRKHAHLKLKKSLQHRVVHFHQLMSNLREKYGRQAKEEIIRLIPGTIGPLWRQKGRGYFLIWDAEHDQVILHPDNEKWEMAHRGLKVDLTGSAFKKHIQRRMGQNREGFIHYKTDTVDGSHGQGPLIQAYVKHFAPFGWVIICGEDMDDFETRLQKRIVDELLLKARDTGAKEYVFVYRLNDMQGGDQFATMLVNINRPELVNQKISDSIEDAKGNPFRKEMLKGIRKKMRPLSPTGIRSRRWTESIPN